MTNTPPKESAVRSALQVIEATELLAQGDTHQLPKAVSTIMREAKRLRPDQLDDLDAYLATRYGSEPSFHGMPGDAPAPVRDAPQA